MTSPDLSDAELERQLHRRAGQRADLPRVLARINADVRSTPQRSRFRLGVSRRYAATLAVAVAVAVAVIAVVAVALWPLTHLDRARAPVGVERVASSALPTLLPELPAGRTLLVNGRIAAEAQSFGPGCTIDPCPLGRLADVPVSVVARLRPAEAGRGYLFSEPWVDGWYDVPRVPSAEQVLAFEVVSQDTVAYLGPVVWRGARPVWTLDEVVDAARGQRSDDLYPVRGWLSGEPLLRSCIPRARSEFTDLELEYYCIADWLASDAYVPVRNDGFSNPVPDSAIPLPVNRYDQLAPDPQRDETGNGVPRFGTYLLRVVGCPATVSSDCPAGDVLGRLDSP